MYSEKGKQNYHSKNQGECFKMYVGLEGIAEFQQVEMGG